MNKKWDKWFEQEMSDSTRVLRVGEPFLRSPLSWSTVESRMKCKTAATRSFIVLTDGLLLGSETLASKREQTVSLQLSDEIDKEVDVDTSNLLSAYLQLDSFS